LQAAGQSSARRHRKCEGGQARQVNRSFELSEIVLPGLGERWWEERDGRQHQRFDRVKQGGQLCSPGWPNSRATLTCSAETAAPSSSLVRTAALILTSLAGSASRAALAHRGFVVQQFVGVRERDRPVR